MKSPLKCKLLGLYFNNPDYSYDGHNMEIMSNFNFFRYFRHASGSLIILSKNLVQYININRLVQCLH